MHYQSDITSVDDKLWTRQELDRWLGKRFKGAVLLVPDDDFYARLHSKDDLINLANKIKKQFGIRNQVSYSFSDSVKAPGTCFLQDKNLHVTLPVAVFGDPLRAAAYVAHLLAHGLLMHERRILLDWQENERLADIACLQAGLGVVILNGINQGGWRTKYLKKHQRNSPALGYFSILQFQQKIREYIKLRGLDELHVARHFVPWLRNAGANKQAKHQQQPSVIVQAEKNHKKSIFWFRITVLLTLLGLAVIVYFVLNPTLTADKKLATLKQNALALKVAHESCVTRYESLKKELPNDQISSARLLSYEQSRCKSFENQYNSAVKAHNDYMRTKN